ncbi:MAG: hypothetical protein EBQ89_06525 [Alphaproteobacteria bacterium]|nr:hypothetical protein [Alphaproteobacteria bacterium]
MLLIAGVLGVIACLFGVMLLGRDITGLIHTGNIDATTFAEFMMKYLPGVWRYFTAFTDHFTPGHPLIVVLDFIFAIPAFIPILALGGVLIVWGFKMKDNRLT